MRFLQGLFLKRQQSSFHWEPENPSVTLDADGRRHRVDIPYLFPKDYQEINRLDYQHYILRQLLKGNIFAPVAPLIQRGGKVLDVGCGTGRWGHDIATTYPRAEVVGFDVENLSHTVSPPRNYQFVQGNLLQGLPFVSWQFQYVHQRLMVGALPLVHWPVVINELKRVVAPGGWVELIEMGTGFRRAGPATEQFFLWWNTISAKRGIDASKMVLIGEWLQQAGLTHVQMETKVLPVGEWGGRLGKLFAQNVLELWKTMRPQAQEMGVAPLTFDTVMTSLHAEWNLNQTQCEVYCACGQLEVSQHTKGKDNGK